MRLTAVYGGLFVLMSAGLLAIFNGMFATQVPSEFPAAQASYASLLMVSVIALGLITVVSLTLAWLIAGRALQPLRAMTETTRRISAESLHERLAMAGPRDELTGLAGTINDLLERLEGSFAAQRRFAANAAHELRTPLATIRASLDVAVAKPAPVPVAVVADRLYEQLDQVEPAAGRAAGAGPGTARGPAGNHACSRWMPSWPRRWQPAPMRSPHGT